MNQYLLSVIIPVYNAAGWLDECLGSILASVTEPDAVELLLVNDGSTDGSGAICDRYANAHIRVFHKPNGGVSTARNLGLDHARGQYIAWVDPDDRVAPEWFSEIRSAIAQNSPDVTVMDTVRFGCGEDTAEVYGRESGFVDRELFVSDVARDIRMLSGMPNKVMKAALFAGVRFDPALPILEDYALMPQVLRRMRTVYYIPKCLYGYRQHENSLLHHIGVERAWQSVQIGLARIEKWEPEFREAAVTAAAIQALRFLENRQAFPDFQPEKEQTRFCSRYIRKNICLLLRDAEVGRKMKIKFFLIAAGLYSPLAILRKWISNEH